MCIKYFFLVFVIKLVAKLIFMESLNKVLKVLKNYKINHIFYLKL